MLGAMQQYPEIIAVNTKVAAYFVLVTLLEENLAQQSPIAFRKLLQYLPDFLFRLFRREDAEEIGTFVGNVRLSLIIQRIEPGARPIMLEQDVVADGVHERTQTLWLQDFSLTQGQKKSSESFLTNVLDRFRRLQARTQFDLDQCAEIGAKMLLSTIVSGSQTLEVRLIKGLELQKTAPWTMKWQTV